MLYRVLTAGAGITSLQNRTLRLGKALEFNDPYDSLLALRHADPRVPQEQLDAAAHKQRETQFSQYGIICMTERPQSSCLWSHYGDKHQGVALGFDFQKNGESIFRVNYSSARPTLDISEETKPGDSKAMKQIIDCLTTKSPDWSYEREFRVILPLSNSIVSKQVVEGKDMHFIPMPTQLREVIIGYHCTNEDRQLIRDTVQRTYDWPISIKRAKLSSHSFEMTFFDA